jgi:hypothetical protein
VPDNNAMPSRQNMLHRMEDTHALSHHISNNQHMYFATSIHEY